jgi:hypothetical protein
LLAVVVCSAGRLGVFDIAQRDRSIVPESKVWPSMEPGAVHRWLLMHHAVTSVAHGTAQCVRVYRVFVSPYHCLCLTVSGGCLVIRFLLRWAA